MTTTPLLVPGLIRRVRREADLSQRDLAALLRVDQSLVARWETGALSPSVPHLEQVLAVAGFRLAVVADAPAAENPDPAPVEPMRQDAVRDRQRRRFPSHLDVHDRQVVLAGERRPYAPWRRRRDEIRAATGTVPADHPTWEALLTARDEARRQRLAARRERVRRLPEWTPFLAPDAPGCTCPTSCWLEPRCGDACPCACEAGRGATLALL